MLLQIIPARVAPPRATSYNADLFLSSTLSLTTTETRPNFFTLLSNITLVLFFFFSCTFAHAATVSWNTDSSGDWDTAANWSTGIVPSANDDVIINRPNANVTVTAIANTTRVIKSVNSTESLHILKGSLSVTGPSIVSGDFKLNAALLIVKGNIATFAATSTTNIDNGQFSIEQGGLAVFPNATSYDATGMGGGVYQFVVNGNGSKLDLSSLTTMKVSTPSSWHAIKAENGGILDLSNVVTINGTTGNVSNPFYIEAFGGQILLPKLTTFLGPWVKFTATNAATLSLPSYAITTPINFHITNAQIDIPQITTLNSAHVELNGSSAVFNTGMLTNIDKTRFYINNGAIFNKIVATNYDATGMGGGVYQFIVNGNGSKLDLSSLATMKVSTPSSWHAIKAENGGILDLSNVVTINGITGNVSNPFYIEAFGGQILLPKLTTFLGPWVKFTATNAATLSLPSYAITTPIDFHITNAQIDIPQITTLNSAYVELNGSGAVFNTGTLTNIDKTRFVVTGGATFNRVSATSYDATGMGGGLYQLIVNGTGSKLDLSSLTTMKVSTPSSWHAIHAANNGILDLSNVVTINGTTGNVSNPFYIEAFGGQILLPKLTTFLGPWVKFSVTNAATLSLPSYAITTPIDFHITNAQIDIPQITTLNSAYVELSGSSAVFNTGMLTNIDNTRFRIQNGAVFNKVIATNYDTTVSPGGTIISVKDAGSKLDLSSVLTLKVGKAGAGTQLFEATNGGTIDFSGLTTLTSVIPSGGSESVKFSSINGGKILFPALTKILGDKIIFEDDGGGLIFPSLGEISGSSFSGSSPTSLSFPMLSKVQNSSFTLSSGAAVNAPSLTELISSTLTLSGTAQFNSGMLTNIDNTRFFLSNGAIFNKVIAISYDVTSLPNSTIVSVKDSGSKLGLSSVLTLKAGKVGNGGIQLFEALDDGVIDFVGLITLTSILPQGASENVKFASATGGEILISALKVLKTSKVQFSADTTGLIDLGSVSEISIGWIALSANEAGSIIDLHSLCTYDGTTFTEILGGKILAPHAIKLSSYEDRAVFGVRSQPQTTTCSGNTCSASQFFSYLPGGYCAAYHGLVKLSSTQLDLDGVAVSQGFGVVGFELLHDPMSGSITSSRLVAIDYKTALATVVGPSLDGRVIRGATFLSDVLLAIDATANALITISPTQGILIGTEIPLILNGLPYDLSDLSDITINKDGAVFIADGNKWFSVNIATGVMAQIAIDVIPLSGTQLPSFSGSTFALAENNTDIELHHLNSNNVDSILSYTPALTQRKVLIPSIPEEAVFDGIYGDLGSTNQFNDTTTSPGLLMRMYSEADMANVLGGFAGKAPQSFTIKTASGTALLQSFILPAVHFANTGSGTLFNYGANAVQDSGSSIGNPLGDDITIIAPQGSGTYGSSYEGYLLIPTGGPVSFNLLLDNRAALYIDDVLILSGDCGVCNSSGNAFLSAGYHKIALYHSDYGGLGTLNLSASGGGLPGGIITAGFFFSSILGAPGPVPITINPQGNGTTVIADWSTYDETLNGDDIHHYNIYKSTTNFSNISAATVIDTVPAGTKSYQLKNLLPTQQIFVAVTATDFAGNVNENVTAVGITPIDIIPPEEVMNIIPVSQLNSVNLSWIPPNTPDLKYFRVYKDNVNVSGDIPKATPSFTVAQLSQATGYDIKITTIDNLDNESLGVTIKVSTLLPNPTGVTGVGENASITASWNPVAPPSLVKNYKVYIESTSFSSVAGLTAKAILGSGILTTKVAGLQNGTQYYVAVTAVNISNGEFSLVSPVTATPQLDQVGPVLTNAKIGGVTLTSGLTVTKSATIEVQATDPAGVSRVDFLLNTGANTITLSQDSSVPYSANWDVSNFDNGPYTIILSAYDTLNNNTQIQYPVTLALAPPEKPTITVPQNGFVTNETILSISGNSELNTTVDLYRNGTALATALPVNSLGFFTTTVTLLDGPNSFHAIAKGKGGTSPQSIPVSVTLDKTVPQAPSGISAQPLKQGKIQLSWNSVTSTGPVTYNLYRATVSFENVSQATKINAAPLQNTIFTDQPGQDKTYYYRVIAINEAGSVSIPSQQAVASADSTPPQASSITYTSSGTIDTQTGAFAPGVVTVTVNVSEPLLAVPFLSYAFTQGVPLSITLVQVGTTTYQGSFVISDTTSNGTGTAVFSAHDLVNNQGNEVESGETILIDSQGPKVTNITTTPLVPIKNDPASPISVTANFTLSEAPKTGTIPEIAYTLSKSATTPTTLSPSAVGADGKGWKVTFTLPASAGGSGPENLEFTYSAKDALGNVQNTIQVPNAFQVYAGELPPLNAPSGLKAKALPNGHVALSWNEVVGAAAYQLFRKGPNDAALTQYGTETPALTFDDATTLDGDYLYAIASVRIENQQKGVSAPSPTVSVTADSIAPNAPQTLALQLSGQGVVATWVASGSSDTKSYALYRKNLAPSIDLDPTGLTPVLNNIISLAAIDSVPSELEHAYAVTAFDAAGNQSLPSNTQYLNFALLPVSSLGITLTENALPQITWSYSGNQTVKYKVVLNEGLADSIVLYEGTSATFVDSGYTGGSRQYTVYVIDQNQAVSVGRTLLLPDLKLDYPAELHLKRGIFNRLDYTIKNAGLTPLTSLRLTTMVMEQIHHSEIFNLNAGEMRVVSVIVGGYAELGDIESVATTIEITPNVGETVEITNSKSATVSSAALLFLLETKDMTSGATGLVRFSVENTSAVTTELITAKNNGANPSPDLKIELTDKNGNLFSTKKVQQFLGNSVITVGNGDTVARIEPGKTFTSDWIVIDVPASVPNEAKVILSVEKLHSAVGTANHIEIQGTGTSKIVSLVEPPYHGEFVSVSSAATFGEKILITGKAINTKTGELDAFRSLDLILSVLGFEYKVSVLTGPDGTFSYEFDPKIHAAGIYAISIVYPGSIEHPKQGEFIVNTLTLSPSTYKINAPVDYVVPVPLKVTAGPATTATEVQFKYLPQDQIGQTLPQGIQITLPPPVTIAPGNSIALEVKFGGSPAAATPGIVYLRLVSAETGAAPLAMLVLNYALSSADPFITFQPTVLETGVAHGGIVSGTVAIQNKGFAPLLNAEAKLLKLDGTPAPSWMYSASDAFPSELAVGETKSIDLYMSPSSQIGDGVYQFKLRITGSNLQPQEMPIVVAVTQSGKGGVLVRAADIYTGTLDDNGQPIVGLAGASIRLQHDSIPGHFYTATTDNNGEAIFTDVPAGGYYLHGSSPGHNPDSKDIQVYPGITVTKELFLLNQLVTIEWSVVQILLQDFYEILLELIFETEVPFPVVVFEPVGTQLPDLKKGEVFMGELTLTNYGLINAIDVKTIFPVPDDVAQFEFLASIPETLAPKQSLKIPYRVTALKNFLSSDGQGGTFAASNDEAPCVYTNSICVTYLAICINGQIITASACAHWHNTHNCDDPAQIEGLGGGGGGGGGGAGGAGYSVESDPLPQFECTPWFDCTDKSAAPTQ